VTSSKRRFVSEEEIEDIFSFHPAVTEDVKLAHEWVRDSCKDLANDFNTALPDCPEKTVLIRQKLFEVMTYANAIIARHGVVEVGGLDSDLG
jgi:hypothetical protein